MESFVSNHFGNAEHGFVYQGKDDILDSIRNEEVAIGEYEQRAEQSRMEAKACYLDWRNEEDEKSGLSFRFRKSVLCWDPPDYRKAFDEAKRVSLSRGCFRRSEYLVR